MRLVSPWCCSDGGSDCISSGASWPPRGYGWTRVPPLSSGGGTTHAQSSACAAAPSSSAPLHPVGSETSPTPPRRHISTNTGVTDTKINVLPRRSEPFFENVSTCKSNNCLKATETINGTMSSILPSQNHFLCLVKVGLFLSPVDFQPPPFPKQQHMQ